MKIPGAKAAVEKEWEKLEKIPAWDVTKVRSKKEVIDEPRTRGAKVHFASLMDSCHLKNAKLEAKHQKYKGRKVLRGGIVKDDSGSYAVFTEQGSSASQMTAAKKSWISYPDCLVAQDKQLTQYLLKPGKNGRCSNIILENPESECPDIWISTNGLNHGPVWKIQSFLLSEICTVVLWQDC